MQQASRLNFSENKRISTVFFGGGTPSSLPSSRLIQLLEASGNCFNTVHTATEISVEVNPATVEGKDLEQLCSTGFNRLSIGIQSFNDDELQALGRPHTAAEARNTFNLARRAGFDNISLDLMYGIPGQTFTSWRKSLATALELGPEHLSIYELTIEEGTVFEELRMKGKLHLPEEDEVLRMMRVILSETEKKGLRRYEISNYARAGLECRHNINYWRNGPYIGIGAGAVSCLAGRRYSAVADIEEYCRRIENNESVISEIEELNQKARFRESVVMGLRMTEGISVEKLEQRFGLNAIEYYGEILDRLQQNDLLACDGDFIRLSDKGLLLANRVMAELV
jgi:oxygen-independent coproporphyrinogen-3 oxidase